MCWSDNPAHVQDKNPAHVLRVLIISVYMNRPYVGHLKIYQYVEIRNLFNFIWTTLTDWKYWAILQHSVQNNFNSFALLSFSVIYLEAQYILWQSNLNVVDTAFILNGKSAWCINNNGHGTVFAEQSPLITKHLEKVKDVPLYHLCMKQRITKLMCCTMDYIFIKSRSWKV